MRTVINFELAKLLKEKGFNDLCENRFDVNGIYTATKLGMHLQPNNYSDSYAAPHISDVVDWLLEKHKIWIEVAIGKDCNYVWFDYYINSSIKPRKDDELGEELIEYEDDPNEKWLNYETTYDSMIDDKFEIMGKLNYSTPKEAYLAAIEYTLNNLIKNA